MAARTLQTGNLPGELTSFVGRRREVAEVRRLLGPSRLVTLTGFGGVGKTRLALRVAADVQRRFPDGAWLVDLAPLHDPGLVAPAVVAALGMRDESTSWSLAALAEYLSDRRVLLVLDNCEHLLDPCAVLVETLLRHAPELTMLATSRQPLGVQGERTFAVPPLPVPDPDGPVPPPDGLAQYDAVTLLVERAQDAEASFAVSEDNVEAVTRLTQRLDGIPLALELAAARLRVLSPKQIVQRLDDRYRLLTSTARTASPRQESLQALIDWSFDLCAPEERVLWSRLSVFPRDFEIDAAEEICAGGELPRDHVLLALAGLVDKSIAVTSGHESIRYRLPETLREYGRRRLVEAGEEEALRRRHRDHYRGLAQRASEEWFGPQQVKWTAWEQVEYVNLRAALEFCLTAPGEAASGLTMVPAMGTYWAISGSLGEGRRFLDRTLAAHPEPSAGRANALWVAAWVAVNQGDITAAETAAEECRVLAQRYGDVVSLGHALVFLGMARMLAGDFAAAERLCEQALKTADGHPMVAASALSRLGEAAVHRGDIQAATERFTRCLTLCQTHGESWIRAAALWNRAVLAWQQGDMPAATEAAMEALRLKRAFQDRLGIAQSLEVLAWVAGTNAAYDRAARLLGAAGAIREDVGGSLFPYLSPMHDRCEEEVRRALGQRAYTQAVRQGAEYALAEAVAYALGEGAEAGTGRPREEAALTPRENEVADLVAQGRSNREIAAALVISQRTVEGHVEHILTKLGFTSRSQIAAWVTERRAASSE